MTPTPLSSSRYIVEPGSARGYWVLDSWKKSSRNVRRYCKWFAREEEARQIAITLNKTSETMIKM